MNVSIYRERYDMSRGGQIGRVRRIISYYARPSSASTGGVNMSRQHWMLNLAKAGFDVTIVAAEYGYTEQLVSHPRIEFRNIRHLGRGRMTMIPLRLRRLFRTDDLVYLHEGWTPSNILAAAHCRRRGIPYVVLPHGVYEAQIVETLRTVPGRRRLERFVLEGAHAVHLFFKNEGVDLRLIAPNAKAVHAMTGMPIPSDAWTSTGTSQHIAWIGRYDVLHKGIDVLFEALSRIPVDRRPRLKMRGPDYFGGKDETIRLREIFGLGESVEIGAEMDRSDVEGFLREAAAFVHVPRWEAFGRTIVENLALGVPVILGDGARIAALLQEANVATIVSSTDPDSVAAALADPPGPLIGSAGREWAIANASWSNAVQALVKQLGILSRYPEDSEQ